MRSAGVKKTVMSLVAVSLTVTGVVIGSKPDDVVAQAVRPPLKIVQLGDSYSAGNGARNASGDRDYSGVSGCYRSSSNWGSQYARALSFDFAVSYVNRACSGGVIAEITGERAFKSAITGQLVACPTPEYPDEEFWVRQDGIPLDRCQRRLRPQIEAIDTSVDLVLMTAGGNDARFARVVEQCFAVGKRDPGDCREAVTFAGNQLSTIENDLVDTFAALRQRMRPDARIVFLTYPYLVPDVNYRLRSLLRTDTFDAGNQIRRLGANGDIRQRQAVQRANNAAGENFVVLVDDIKQLFEGHLPNPNQSEPRNPDRWIYEFETRVPAEWYHYNRHGHQEIANLLATRGTFGVAGRTFANSADLDIVFVVDTTGSMGGVIAQVRDELSTLVNQLASTTNSFRVGLVSYRDFPERTGWDLDYPSRVDQPFTSDLATIQAAINTLTAEGGGDYPETVFSGLATAIDFPWRPGVAKVAIVLGDAPALSPEPISGLTAQDIIDRSIAVDPVQVIGVDVGGLNDNSALGVIAEGTGGSIVNGATGLIETVSGVLDTAVNQPFAWLGVAYAGETGTPVTFDATGSYDPSGTPLSLYEWDFDGDGVYDRQTTSPTVSHTYTSDFTGYVVVRVTGVGGTALGSSRVVVNANGYVPQGDETPCEVDGRGAPVTVDDEGRPELCTVASFPAADLDGVIAESGSTSPVVPNGPGRLLDTRSAEQVSAGTVVNVDAAGRFGVPDDAQGVVLNVATVDAGDAGFVSVLPGGTLRPGGVPQTSNVNFDASAAPAIANAVIVPLGADGSVEVYSSMDAHILVDVLGHIPAGVEFSTLAEPRRVLDTRPDGSNTNTDYPVDVIGDFGPDGARFVIVNLTLVNTIERGGYVTAWPAGSAMPPTSNLNTFGSGQTRAGLAVLPIGTANEIIVRADVAGDLLVDVFGYLGDGDVGVLDPFPRVFDTRPDNQLDAGELRSVPVTGVQNIPADTSFVLANVTAVEASDAGFVSVLAGGTLAAGEQPGVSNLNYPGGGTVANTVLVPIGPDGTIEVFSQSSIHLLVDILAAF